MSSSSSGNNDEAMEAIRSLADFHHGEWQGTANSFSVTADVAAGVVQRKVSSAYNVSVKLGMDAGRQFSLTETISWDDRIALRSLPLRGCNLDVDSVDASYSLDSTLPDFPTGLSGTDKPYQWIIEHCIAAGEDRRARCFAMYGIDQSLTRVVVCNEERLNENGTKVGTGRQAIGLPPSTRPDINSMFTANDLIEMQNDVDRLVDRIVANIDQPISRSLPAIEVGQGQDDNNEASLSTNSESSSDTLSRLDQMGASSSSTDGAQKYSQHDMSLLELSSGIWLGDAIVRDTPNFAASPLERGRGFGASTSSSSSSSSSVSSSIGQSQSMGLFEGWTHGVQKVAVRFMWNFGDEIRKVVDLGKAIGSPLDGSLAKSLSGTVCVDESLSRRVPKDERMVYLDWSQDMVGFLLGPFAVQVPRYITFDPSSTRSTTRSKPFYTEFCIFQSVTNEDSTVGGIPSPLGISRSEGDMNLPEVVCSKICRLYSFDGKMKQGSTSFYTLQRFGIDDSDDS